MPRNDCRMRNSVSRRRRQIWRPARKRWLTGRTLPRRLPLPPLRNRPQLRSRLSRRKSFAKNPKFGPKSDRRLPTARSIGNWNHSAPGAKRRTTVTSGNRAKRRNPATGVPTPKATGFTPTPAGLGSRMSLSAGRLTITGAGCGCAESVGFGCREMNGRRPGFRGEPAGTMSAGRRCRRKRASIAAVASIIGRTIITISVPTNMRLCRTTNSVRHMSGAPWFPRSATSPS